MEEAGERPQDDYSYEEQPRDEDAAVYEPEEAQQPEEQDYDAAGEQPEDAEAEQASAPEPMEQEPDEGPLDTSPQTEDPSDVVSLNG